MSTYRGPQSARNALQLDGVRGYVGHTALWMQYASASAGIPDVGINELVYYNTRLITAFFGDNSTPAAPEHQIGAGMLANADIYAVLREPVGRNDRIEWRGETYRVEGDPLPSIQDSMTVVMLKRGKYE